MFEREQEEQEARTSSMRSRDPRRRIQVQASYSPAAFSDSEDGVEEVSSEVRETSPLLSCSKDIEPVLKLCNRLTALKEVEEQAKLVAQIVSSLP